MESPVYSELREEFCGHTSLYIFMGLYKEEPQVKSTGAVIAQGCQPYQCFSTINQNKQRKCQKG